MNFPFEYNVIASLLTLASVVALIVAGRFLLFKIPAFAETYAFNKEENKKKYKGHEKYAQRLGTSNKVALVSNLVFLFVILPFFVTLEAQSLGKIALDIFLILMVYDFFYYVTHRFLFHGNGYFRKVHGVHHQARSPTSIDALLLHPLEAFIGIALFMLVIIALGLINGGPFSIVTMIITNLIYTQINQFNHVKTDWNSFPFKTLNWIAYKHSIHHIDMKQGNYATITLFYDKIFGTLD